MTINFNSYLKLLRLVDARGYFLIALFGFVAAEGFLFPPKAIAVFWAMIFLLLGFGFSINDCYDKKEDELDKTKRNPLVSKEISFKKGLVFSVFLAGLGLLLAAFYGPKVFLLCFAGVILAFLYSAPPARLKSRFLLDLLSHGLFAGAIIFFFPLLFFETKLTPFHYLIVLALFYFSVILELRNEFEDYESDKSAGLKTTAFVLGRERTENLLRYLAIISPLTLFPVFNLISLAELSLFLILTLIFFFLFLFAEEHKLVKNYKLLDAYIISAMALISLSIF